jgi:hypothetical protein
METMPIYGVVDGAETVIIPNVCSFLDFHGPYRY